MIKRRKISTGTLPVSESLIHYLDLLDLDYKTVIARSDISAVAGRKDALSLATFYNIIGGQVSRITNKNARKLAKGIGIPVEDLYLIALGKMGGKAAPPETSAPREIPVFDNRELMLHDPKRLMLDVDLDGRKRRTLLVFSDAEGLLAVSMKSAGLPFLAKGGKGVVALADMQATLKDDDWVVAKIRRDKGAEIQLRRYRKPSHHRASMLFGPEGSEEIAFEDLCWCYRVQEIRFLF